MVAEPRRHIRRWRPPWDFHSLYTLTYHRNRGPHGRRSGATRRIVQYRIVNTFGILSRSTRACWVTPQQWADAITAARLNPWDGNPWREDSNLDWMVCQAASTLLDGLHSRWGPATPYNLSFFRERTPAHDGRIRQLRARCHRYPGA